jgi:hypothetical protein
MKPLTVLILLNLFLANQLCFGQEFNIDSCGVDSNPELNYHEIIFLDSIMFAPLETKKSGTIDPKVGFDFKNKKIAFFSCTINKNTKGKGLISKEDFFELAKPDLKGHAGRGLIEFNEKEKKVSNGYDAVIIIDCPYDLDVKEQVLSILSKKKKEINDTVDSI